VGVTVAVGAGVDVGAGVASCTSSSLVASALFLLIVLMIATAMDTQPVTITPAKVNHTARLLLFSGWFSVVLLA
jgi:hypothetical protein